MPAPALYADIESSANGRPHLVGNRPRPRLSDQALQTLRGDVDVPTYDRSKLVPAIVHIGVGGFHRAHQATYLDELARRGCTGWGEIGVGLRSPTMRDALVDQDCLFSVLTAHAGGEALRILGPMVDYFYGPDQPDRVLAALVDERTRIVTLTITGGAYPVDADGHFDPEHPDLLTDETEGGPRSAFGYLVEALALRREAGLAPFTVLSCDNIPANGPVARAAVLGHARQRDPDLAAWIADRGSFPSSMVDRITPGADDATLAHVAARLGVDDRGAVRAEPFTQWVVEDDFCNGRPPWEEVGVEMVEDVGPYKVVKTRLLNGCHSAIGYLGHLAGHRTISEAMENPVIVDYVLAMMSTEIAPLLPKIPGFDIDSYQRKLLERFANPKVADELTRLCGRGSVKVPAYLLPSVTEARRRRRPVPMLTLAVAGWMAYLARRDPHGRPLVINDVRAEELQRLAPTADGDPRALLGIRSIFGDLADDQAFVSSLHEAVRDVLAVGPVGAMCLTIAETMAATA